MPSDLILIDTDVWFDYSRGIEQSKEKLNELSSEKLLNISVITHLELMVGCENKREFISLQKFLSDFEIIQLDHSISQKSVELFERYRLSHGVLISDMFIASTALLLDIPLLSKNRKDFHFIENLELVDYHRVTLGHNHIILRSLDQTRKGWQTQERPGIRQNFARNKQCNYQRAFCLWKLRYYLRDKSGGHWNPDGSPLQTTFFRIWSLIYSLLGQAKINRFITTGDPESSSGWPN